MWSLRDVRANATNIVLVAIAAIILFKIVIPAVTGWEIGFIDPIRLRVCHLKKRGKFKIRYIQINPFRKEITVDGVTLLDIGSKSKKGKEKSKQDIEKGDKAKDVETPGEKKPLKFLRYIPLIKRILIGFKFRVSDIKLQKLDLSIGDIGLFVNTIPKTGQLNLEFFVRRALWRDEIVCAESIVSLKADLITDPSLLNDNKFIKNIFVDFKFGGITIPMSYIAELKPKKEVDVTTYFESERSENEILATNKMETEAEREKCQFTEEDIFNTVNQIEDTLDKLRDFADLIADFTISIDKFKIKEVQVTQHPVLIQMNKYMNYTLFCSNFTFNATKFNNDMPGFKLQFKDEDSPFKMSMAVSRLDMYVNINRVDKNITEVLKLADIPNVTLFGETNLLSQKFRTCDTSESVSENALFNIKGTISSPTIDISLSDLSFVKSFMKNIKVFTSTCSGCIFKNEVRKEEQMNKSKSIINTYFETFLPLINVKINLEDPKYIINHKNNLIISNVSVLMIEYKSQCNLVAVSDKRKEIQYESVCDIEMLDLRLSHVFREKDYEHVIFQIDSIALDNKIKLLPELNFSTYATVDTFNLDLSELPTLIMLSEVVKNLDDEIYSVEQYYFNGLYEKFSSVIKNAMETCKVIGKNQVENEIPLKEVINNSLPDFFDYFVLTVRNVTATLGARSVFMPKDKFTLLEPQSGKDFVDGKLRKYCNEINKLQIAFFGNKTQWHSNINAGHVGMTKSGNTEKYTAYQSSDLDDISTSDATEVERPWNLNVLIDKITSTVIGECPQLSDKLTVKTVARVSVVSVKVFPETDFYETTEAPRVIVQLENKSVKAIISLMNIFLILSGIHTLHQIFGNAMEEQNGPSKAKEFFLAMSKVKKKSAAKRIRWSDLKSMLTINMLSEYYEQIFILPNDLRTALEFNNSFLTVRNVNDISFTGDYFRTCIESPTVKNYWVRLISIVKFNVAADLKSLKKQPKMKFDELFEDSPGITLENESWHFSIPYDFEMFRIFDNFSTIAKTMKQLIHSFKTGSSDLIIFSKPVKTPSLPKIKLKSKRMLFSVDDDPFESELNTIFQVGLQEQKERLEKRKEFDEQALRKLHGSKKASGMCGDSVEDIILKRKIKLSKKNIPDQLINKDMPLISTPFNIDGKQNKKKHTEEMISSDLESEYEALQENISHSWIERIRKIRAKQNTEFKNNFEYIWGQIDYSKLPPDINKKVLSFTSNPFLMNLIIEGIDVDILTPKCGVQNIPDFLHKIGKGIPKDTEYSIMVPMYLDAKFSEIRWHLRDYPLPFIHMPPLLPSQSRETTSIRIHGDFMVTEDMIYSQQELRTVFVPLVPSIIVENQDKFYSLLVPRTMTSIKLYTDLQFDLHSKDTLLVTWGGSYSPAIQQVMQCFDNFSKPPLDPSMKTGFWDKIRYIFHARVNINLKNNGKFEIALKGSKSPYKIAGQDAGFIIGFEEGVQIVCNPDDNPKNFLSCTADRVHFSIPNYFAKPLLVWSRPSSDSVFIANQVDTNLQDSSSFYYLLDLEHKINQASDINTMKLAYIEKTGIKLTGGMKLALGFVFERLVPGTNNRTFDCRDHWDVRLCNPIYVSDLKKHDSFSNYRSDFIHLSLVLTSKSENAYNALQLSPKSLRTFFSWWKMFSGNFPVRRGPLFGLQSIAPKFGEHLATMSYSADVSPLYITHMYHNLDAENIMKKSFLDVAEYAGIKARVDRFIMDLHQRKETFTEYQEELDRTKKVTAMKFLEGAVSTYDIDIRAVHGIFTALEYIEQREDAVYEIHDNNMQWIDLTDFQEAFYVDTDNYLPNIKILPMLFANKFSYKKRASYGDKFQVDPNNFNPIEPFDNAHSHKCVLREPFKANFGVIENRLESLQQLEASIKADCDKDNEHKHDYDKYVNQASLSVKNVEALLEDLQIMNGVKDKPAGSSGYHYPAVELIQDTNSEGFENKYYVQNMLLKWNEAVRDIAFKFLHFANLTNQFMSLSSHKSERTFNDIIQQRLQREQRSDDESNASAIERVKSEVEFENNSDADILKTALLNMFEETLSELGTNIGHKVWNNHFVQFNCPQIQFVSDEDPDISVLVSSPTILLKVVSFDEDTQENVDNTFLKRYGFFMSNANAFIFHRKKMGKYPELVFDASLYGQDKGADWPPWLGVEVSFDPTPLKKFALIDNFSAFTYIQKLLPFSPMYDNIKDSIENKISGFLPTINIAATSRDFLAAYKIIANLVLYVEPYNKALKRQIEAVSLALDLDDTDKLKAAVASLANTERVLDRVVREFIFRRRLLKDVDMIDLSNVYNERMNQLLRMYIIMKVFTESNRNENDCTIFWDFKIKEIRLHMLHNNSKPFMDIIVQDVNFQRLLTDTGYTDNMATVKTMHVYNKDKDAAYHDLLAPCPPKHINESRLAEQPIVALRWGVEKPVGGIRIFKTVSTNITGISVKLEEETINRIVQWLSLEDLKNVTLDDDDNDSRADTDSSSSFSVGKDNKIRISGTKDVDIMMKRSTSYITIENMLINSFKLNISFKGKGKLRLANVTDFLFTFPTLLFENQTMTLSDMMVKIKNILIKVLLKHTGKFLGTKFKHHPSPSLSLPSNGSPLKQITSFSSKNESKESQPDTLI
ncbi:Protein FMP27, mitochondrial [Nakaseomyces bracarensis]|uniref:Protein FMP27, mitochondrial n=1 Tax=Nakaseomyces bracarensis TaxID=273131 RepID=A0ABR4NRN2_9SACH